MSDSYVETEHQGYFSRVLKSFMGVLFGLALVPGAVALLAWNEYRTVHRSRGIDEAEKVCVSVSSVEQIPADTNGKLVHLQGKANTEETLADPVFNYRKNALRIRRQVEMYQWTENKTTERHKSVGGGETTTTKYTYHQKWHNDRVSSSSFHHEAGHQNPSQKYEKHSTDAAVVNIGAFQLSPTLIAGIEGWSDAILNATTLFETVPEADRAHLKVEGDHIYYAVNPNSLISPSIGDQRIRLSVVEPCVVSVLAAQQNGRLTPFQTSNGEPIESVELGEVTAADMFTSLRTMNALIAWGLRAGGWGIGTLGFLLILGPLSTLSSFIPFLENITGFATFVISAVMGTILAFITIGVAWLAVRPLLSGVLFGLAGLALFLLFRRKGTPTDTVLNPEANFVN